MKSLLKVAAIGSATIALAGCVHSATVNQRLGKHFAPTSHAQQVYYTSRVNSLVIPPGVNVAQMQPLYVVPSIALPPQGARVSLVPPGSNLQRFKRPKSKHV